MKKTGVEQERYFQLRVGLRLEARVFQVAIFYEPHAASADADFGMGVHEPDLAFQPFGEADVVAVHACDIFPPGKPDAPVEGVNGAEVAFVCFKAYSRVAERPDDVSAAVGRAVVQDQKFKIGERLVQNALYGLSQIGFAVMDRHQHGYFRRDT